MRTDYNYNKLNITNLKFISYEDFSCMEGRACNGGSCGEH